MTARRAIVLVDDDESHVLVAKRAIQRSQLEAEVHTVSTGGEALELLGLAAESAPAERRVAVVMLDLGLPDMSGWDVLGRIRKHPRMRTLPVVLVSSSNRPEDVDRGYEAGANSYLVKRHERGKPGQYVAEAARYWVELNEPPRLGRPDHTRSP